MVTQQPVIAAIGNFDGVHRGHQHLLNRTIALAEAHNAKPGAVIFDPHPRRHFQPDTPPFLLTTPQDRADLLREFGVAEVKVLTFDNSVSSLSPDAFIDQVLKEQLGLAGIAAGADFRFGAKRAGDWQALKAGGARAGLVVEIVDIVGEAPDSAKFGSSAIRQALREGDAKAATEMLGRPWRISGVVEQGQQLGRTIGFPTANVRLGELVEPRKGVYAARGRTGGLDFQGVANFGRRPTVGESAPLLEIHIFDFSGDIYGQEIEIELVDFLRDEQKFESLDALKEQIGRDRDAARALLTS